MFIISVGQATGILQLEQFLFKFHSGSGLCVKRRNISIRKCSGVSNYSASNSSTALDISNGIEVIYGVSTPQDKIIDQLESDIERLKLEIFELKGEVKILKKMLKDASEELRRQQGFYDADGDYVEN